ncbi:MAG: hypothetical protein QT04_C0060G0016 [archaeon GW2011_AR11]|nr:MAG: hypothetical protein QT04_C0060G0016 [archaeon GW2011_AR11]
MLNKNITKIDVIFFMVSPYNTLLLNLSLKTSFIISKALIIFGFVSL